MLTDLRYTVIPNPEGRHKKGGYAIHDNNPPWLYGEDVEGVGWYEYNPPRRQSSVICWFKRKCDAQRHCDVLNESDQKHPEHRPGPRPDPTHSPGYYHPH